MLDYKEVPNIQVVTLAPKQLCVAIAIKLLEVRGEYITSDAIGEVTGMTKERARALIHILEHRGIAHVTSKTWDKTNRWQYKLTKFGEDTLRNSIKDILDGE
tara:strand:- start:2880 stop:3185 length:306 start_codon:yes stop_codon:yes gene_type:complete